MKISISTRISLTEKSVWVIEISQEFEQSFTEIITGATSVADDLAAADRSESTIDGELTVRFVLLLTSEKSAEFNEFTKKLCLAFAELFLKDFMSADKEIE
jgi:hypothetical protein